jgi:hypothetical protein
MRYTEEQYKTKVQSLLPQVKEYLGSDHLEEGIIQVQYRKGLPYAKEQALTEEIMFILVGLEPKEKFVQNLKQYLGLDEAMAQKIAKDAEDEIFIPAGDLLVPMIPQPVPTPVAVRKVTPITTHNPMLNKQLENPAPEQYLKPKPPTPISSQPAGAAQQVPQSAPIAQPQQQQPNQAPQPAPKQQGSILEARMGGGVGMPKEEVKINPQGNVPTGNQPPKYAKDPYREPIE